MRSPWAAAAAMLTFLVIGGVPALAPVAQAQDDRGETTASANGWTATVLPQTIGTTMAVGIAVGPSSMVAVGQRACIQGRRETSRCWGPAWTSPDGITWEAVDPRSSGLDLGIMRPTTSGPEIGLQGVAYGPAGFLVFGRVAEQGGQRSAVWRSDDGTSWERATAMDAFPTGTRLRTMLGADDGYLLGGVIYLEKAPRAAIWSSPDGKTWTQARAKEVFEIGGYIDTMEDPSAGGVDAFALYPGTESGAGLLANGVVAVGQACMPAFDKDPWAWNGTCWGQLWRSPDGLSWKKEASAMPRPHGAITSVAAVAERLVVDAPICLDPCGSAMLLTPDGTEWHVAYGSPVDGQLKALTVQGGHFFALLVGPSAQGGQDGDLLALWASSDGTNWALEEAQPILPVAGMWIYDVDMAVAGDRLVVTVSGTDDGDDLVSVALLSPPQS